MLEISRMKQFRCYLFRSFVIALILTATSFFLWAELKQTAPDLIDYINNHSFAKSLETISKINIENFISLITLLFTLPVTVAAAVVLIGLADNVDKIESRKEKREVFNHKVKQYDEIYHLLGSCAASISSILDSAKVSLLKTYLDESKVEANIQFAEDNQMSEECKFPTHDEIIYSASQFYLDSTELDRENFLGSIRALSNSHIIQNISGKQYPLTRPMPDFINSILREKESEVQKSRRSLNNNPEQSRSSVSDTINDQNEKIANVEMRMAVLKSLLELSSQSKSTNNTFHESLRIGVELANLSKDSKVFFVSSIEMLKVIFTEFGRNKLKNSTDVISKIVGLGTLPYVFIDVKENGWETLQVPDGDYTGPPDEDGNPTLIAIEGEFRQVSAYIPISTDDRMKHLCSGQNMLGFSMLRNILKTWPSQAELVDFLSEDIDDPENKKFLKTNIIKLRTCPQQLIKHLQVLC